MSSEDLAEYKEQLAQVQELLSQDPKNEEYLELEKNCLEVIQLTESVLSATDPSNEKATKTVDTSSSTDTLVDRTDDEENENETKADEHSVCAKVVLRCSEGGTGKKKSRWAIPTIFGALEDEDGKSTRTITLPPYIVGEHCEVRGEGAGSDAQAWHPALVVSVDPQTLSCKVKLADAQLGTRTLSVPYLQMRKLKGADNAIDSTSLVKGCAVKAFYVADGLWYDGVIKGVAAELASSGWYYVQYTNYGNTETLPIEYLAPVRIDVNAQKRKIVTSGGRPLDESVIEAIPNSLEILPSDTPEERENKLRRRKAIKSKNRFLKKDIDSNKRQASWQTFQSSIATKKTKFGGGGGMSRLAKRPGTLFQKKR